MSPRKPPTLSPALLNACGRNPRKSRGPATRRGKVNVHMNASKEPGHSELFRQSLNRLGLEDDIFRKPTRSNLSAESPIIGISPEMIENKWSHPGIGWRKRQNEGASWDVYENKGSEETSGAQYRYWGDIPRSD